jgi:hypothetical protein
MLKRKIVLIIIGSLTIITLLMMAIPVLAADSVVSTNPTRITQVNKTKILLRLLLVRDEVKVNAFMAKAVDAGKLTSAQAIELKYFWTEHHSQFIKNGKLIRLLKVQDESKVQAYLDKAVIADKLEQSQADKIIQVWKILH